MTRVTDEAVERMCQTLARNDWLPTDWDAKRDTDRCSECGRLYNSEGDGGANTRNEVRLFLEVALGEREEEECW